MPKGHYLVVAVKDAIWELRAAGVSEAEIARRLVMPKRTVSKYLQRMGGIRPRPRRWAECCLSLVEREEISRGIARGDSARAIGRTLGRSHTTVSREINRCGGRGRYRAHAAEQTAWGRARRPRPSKFELCSELRELVIERLGQDHSPQQISGWLRLSYPDNDQMQVSHETIYRALYVQARGSLRRELTRHLRTRCQKRYARTHSNRGQGPGCIAGMVMISERPPEVCDRAVPHQRVHRHVWLSDCVRPPPAGTAAQRTTHPRPLRHGGGRRAATRRPRSRPPRRRPRRAAPAGRPQRRSSLDSTGHAASSRGSGALTPA